MNALMICAYVFKEAGPKVNKLQADRSLEKAGE
jgi:hypothetical protein